MISRHIFASMAWRLALLDGVDVDASTTDRGRVDGVEATPVLQ